MDNNLVDLVSQLESDFKNTDRYKELNKVLEDLDSQHKKDTDEIANLSKRKRANRRNYKKAVAKLKDAQNDYIVNSLKSTSNTQPTTENQDNNANQDYDNDLPL